MESYETIQRHERVWKAECEINVNSLTYSKC